jgi:uncharacterized protein YjiS (DUF1127 family)
MTDTVLTSRDARLFVPGLTPRFTRKRAVAAIRRMWRAYCDRQARRATAVIMHALDDRTLADIGLRRTEIESLLADDSDSHRRRYDPDWRSHG